MDGQREMRAADRDREAVAEPLWVLGPWGGLVLMQSVGLIGADHGRKRRDRRR
ncbi:hypothetical protein OG767_28350 [Micromonospora sp. NBC_01392]|uniref:hypothetical protein n=1 Tax=Micromonospora sp. NBC_01392 TaxID=2903588 RepID=UPI00324D85C2